MPARGLTRTLNLGQLFWPVRDSSAVGLAVSGGADSLALMLLAAEYAAAHERAPKFIVYSVDHGLRPEAAAEVAMVLREAARLGFSARGLKWRGPHPETGVQAAAREARYRLIGEAMAADGMESLLTAHHRNDQAETVLMRLAHGSGIDGLRGMEAVSRVGEIYLIRPLLQIDPAELRAVVEAAGLTPAEDPSNADETYERVRWRKLLPQLAAAGLDAERVAQFARRAGEVGEALEQMTELGLKAVQFEPAGATVTAADLAALPKMVRTRVVQAVLNRVGGDRKPHALAAVEELAFDLAHVPVAATLHGCIVRSDGVAIHISPEPLTGARARRVEATKA